MEQTENMAAKPEALLIAEMHVAATLTAALVAHRSAGPTSPKVMPRMAIGPDDIVARYRQVLDALAKGKVTQIPESGASAPTE